MTDTCIFHKYFADGTVQYVAIYVDDVIVISSSKAAYAAFRDIFSQKFKIVDNGPIEWILGIRIIRDRVAGTLSMDQSLYITTALTDLGLSDLLPLTSPMVPNWSADTEISDFIQPTFTCPQAVGKFMHALNYTRPDIAFSTKGVFFLKTYQSKTDKASQGQTFQLHGLLRWIIVY